MQKSLPPVPFVLLWLCVILTQAQNMSPRDLSCLRSSPSDDGQAQITFLAYVAGVRTLYVSRWSEDQLLVSCERTTDPVVTERYGGSCDDRSDSQGHEIIRSFNVSSLVAPGAPCALVSARGETEGELRRKRRWIFPGTRWCGTGTSASRYDQLGEDSGWRDAHSFSLSFPFIFIFIFSLLHIISYPLFNVSLCLNFMSYLFVL